MLGLTALSAQSVLYRVFKNCNLVKGCCQWKCL